MYRDPAAARDPDALARRLRDLSRIRKLVRLAEDQEGRPEGRSARARADELMARHGLSRATLPRDDLGLDFQQRSFAVGRAETWRQTLVHAIADYFDCVALHRKDATEVETWGPEHALPQVEYTFIVYLRQLRSAWTAHVEEMTECGVWTPLTRRQQVEARDAFCVSFTLGVKERLERDRAAEREDDPRGWDHLQRQRRSLERWMRSGGVRWRASPHGVGALDAEGFRAGLEAEVDAALRSGPGSRQLTG